MRERAKGQVGSQCELSRPGFLGAVPEGASIKVLFYHCYSHRLLLEGLTRNIYLSAP